MTEDKPRLAKETDRLVDRHTLLAVVPFLQSHELQVSYSPSESAYSLQDYEYCHLSPEEVVGIIADPLEYVAGKYDCTRETLIAWRDNGRDGRCRATTTAGRRCTKSVMNPVSHPKWYDPTDPGLRYCSMHVGVACEEGDDEEEACEPMATADHS